MKMIKKYGSGTRNDFSVFIPGSIKMPYHANDLYDYKSYYTSTKCITDDNNNIHLVEKNDINVDYWYVQYLKKYKFTATQLREQIYTGLKDNMIPDLKNIVLEYTTYPCRITYSLKYDDFIEDDHVLDLEHIIDECSPLDILRAENGEGNLDFSVTTKAMLYAGRNYEEATFTTVYEFCYAKFAEENTVLPEVCFSSEELPALTIHAINVNASRIYSSEMNYIRFPPV